MAPHTAARQYTEPTERSIPPEMTTKVAPTAIMAKKEVFLASLSRLSARKNLLTVWASPVCRSRTSSDPPKTDNTRARAITTPRSPVSFNRGMRRATDQRPKTAFMPSLVFVRRAFVNGQSGIVHRRRQVLVTPACIVNAASFITARSAPGNQYVMVRVKGVPRLTRELS